MKLKLSLLVSIILLMEIQVMFEYNQEGTQAAIKFLREEIKMEHESLSYLTGLALVALANHEAHQMRIL